MKRRGADTQSRELSSLQKLSRKYIGPWIIYQGVPLAWDSKLTRLSAQFSRPYQIATDVGVKIFLPARYAEEIKNIKDLSFKEAMKWVSRGLGRTEAIVSAIMAKGQTCRNSSLDTRVLRHSTLYPILVILCRR